MEQNKDQSGAAVCGEAVVDGGWNVLYDKNTESDHYVKHSDALAAARRLAQGGRFDVRIVKVGVSARAADAPSEPSEAMERIFESWDGCKYDDIDIGAALRADFKNFVFIKSRAADAPSEPSELAKRLRSHASLFKVGCEPYSDVLAAADALDSQPTDGGVRNG